MECINDKLSIKSLLFTKAAPNYVLPVPINGHKVYSCTDCGDKFILESSYNFHINRKSVKITYMCRHCGQMLIFFNRCNLLSHIRSHGFKTATINVSDLKVEPVPLSKLNYITQQNNNVATTTNDAHSYTCLECKSTIKCSEVLYKERAKHYMQYTNKVYTCPVCLFAMPTICALKAHLRIHLKCPPFYCPECGMNLCNRNISYPYNHHCQGFKMMRATARLKCPSQTCDLIHPNEIRKHFRSYHIQKIFKCQHCYVACFSDKVMEKHSKSHELPSKPPSLLYQCDICQGKILQLNQLHNHLKSHVAHSVYPCWICGMGFEEISQLIVHHADTHDFSSEVKNVLQTLLTVETSQSQAKKKSKIYRVVKRCDQCKRSFTYKCELEQINSLPNECPLKCTYSDVNKDTTQTTEQSQCQTITCHMCNNKIPEDWEKIKIHYADQHKAYRCIDLKVNLARQDLEFYLKKKCRASKQRKHLRIKKKTIVKNKKPSETMTSSNADLIKKTSCKMCSYECENEYYLEAHLKTHRDPCMAYQCMECGQCFVVKPSFSKHLLLEHGISDVDEYVCKKQCYNEDAFTKHHYTSVTNEPLRENQCKICRIQFENSNELEKHFRVHGMAFLMKNNSSKNNSP